MALRPLHIAFLLTFFPLTFSFSPLSKSYDHAMYLDENEKYELLWTVNQAKETVSFAAVVNTTGWVGFGVAKGLAGTMKNSDIAIGYVTADGKGYLVDRHGTGNVRPVRDAQQDYTLTGYEEQNGQTILKFDRAYETCDKDDNKLQVGTTKLLFAYNDKDPNPSEEASLAYHGLTQRGSRSVNLFGFKKQTTGPSLKTYFDITVDKLTVPEQDTTYWCTVSRVRRSDIGGKRHVVEMEPVVTAGNEGVVHHIVIYICDHGSLNSSHMTGGFHCDSPNMPSPMAKCRGGSVLYAWAIGGESFILPDHVGILMGDYEETYYLTVTHYDNPLMKKGIVDSSGIRFYYTDKLRQYNSGSLLTGRGLNQNIVIPPGQKEWHEKAYCNPSCSKQVASSSTGDIKIFAALPHEHTAGNGISTTLVRDGKEIAEIIRDDNYDFNYQQTHMLSEEIVMKPEDAMITSCRYNTESRQKPTFGGEATNQEMCVTFLLFYPKIDFYTCSSMNNQVLNNFTAKYGSEISTVHGKYYNWTAVPWTDEKTEELKQLLDTDYITSSCYFKEPAGGKKVVEQFEKKPSITVPLPRDNKCESAGSSSNKCYSTMTVIFVISLITHLFVN